MKHSPRQLRIGLIGSGFMGKAHAIALRAAPVVFDLPAELVCEVLAEHDAATAAERARQLGFRRSTGDWREVVADPQIDVIDICAPNHLHYPMARAALEAGKAVFCEKPLALDVAESRELARLATESACPTLVGFNYAKNPAIALAAELIAGGEIGEPWHFRGTHIEDYLSEASVPGSWRTRRASAGLGALGDLCHILSVSQRLLGDVAEVCADLQTVIARRPAAAGGGTEPVENEDQAHALLRFGSGVIGTLECSRVARGRKNGLTFEIGGSLGSLCFDQERQNELWLYRRPRRGEQEGFQRILLGPEHPDYGDFCPAPGHGLGFNDLKVIEVRDLVAGIVNGASPWPDFAAAAAIDEVLAAMERSSRERRWIEVSEVTES